MSITGMMECMVSSTLLVLARKQSCSTIDKCQLTWESPQKVVGPSSYMRPYKTLFFQQLTRTLLAGLSAFLLLSWHLHPATSSLCRFICFQPPATPQLLVEPFNPISYCGYLAAPLSTPAPFYSLSLPQPRFTPNVFIRIEPSICRRHRMKNTRRW